MLSIKESVDETPSTRSPTLETSDIQATVLRPPTRLRVPRPGDQFRCEAAAVGNATGAMAGRDANTPNPANSRHPGATMAMSSFSNTASS